MLVIHILKKIIIRKDSIVFYCNITWSFSLKPQSFRARYEERSSCMECYIGLKFDCFNNNCGNLDNSMWFSNWLLLNCTVFLDKHVLFYLQEVTNEVKIAWLSYLKIEYDSERSIGKKFQFEYFVKNKYFYFPSSLGYSPGWALASSTISLHFLLCFTFSIPCFIFFTFRSATTSSIHLKESLPFLLLKTVFLSSSFLASFPLPFSLHSPAILFFELL